MKDGSGLPNIGKRGSKITNRSKFLSQNVGRSTPTSPALSGVGSPALGPTSISLSQQQAEQAKTARKPVIQLLAVEPMLEDDLRSRITDVASNDITQALEKVADFKDGKWELRPKFYRELDVWTFDYESSDDRQRAIDNATKAYDKFRLGQSEPEWERLLPKHERGTGKWLSKFQSRLAVAESGTIRTPRIHVHKAEESGQDTPIADDGHSTDKRSSKGNNSERATSQPPTSKVKKLSQAEAQAKRLLGKPSKAASKPTPAPRKEKAKEQKTKEQRPKEQPLKHKPKYKPREPEKPSGKVLSSQFVSDSDDEDDPLAQAPTSAPAPVKKPAPKPLKRSREDDIETSDSSIPLSKKVKKETQNRISDNSQSSQRTSSSYSTHSLKN